MKNGRYNFFKDFEGFAETPAIVDADKRISYAELAQAASEIADALRQRQISRGDRIAILAQNSVEYVVALWAMWDSGVAAVPLSTRLPASRIENTLEQTGCKFIIVDKELALPFLKSARAINLTDLLENGPVNNENSTDQDFHESDIATIVMTSGSSGRPKAALHALEQHYYSARGANQRIPLTTEDRWLLSLPLYHVGGLAILFRCALAGACVLIPRRSDNLSKSVRELLPTHMSLVATQLQRLISDPSTTELLQMMAAILVGGGPVPVALLKTCEDLNIAIAQTYGSTEMSSQICTNLPGESQMGAGQLLPYRKLQIDSDGLIWVSGKTLFQGYIDDVNPFVKRDGHNWFATGDLGRLDEDGNLHIQGRSDNMFISGGENIQPEEIESALSEYHGVENVIVVPAVSEQFGNRPVAFVKPSEGNDLDGEFLRSWLESRLPRFKIPDAFYNWPDDADLGASIKPSRESFCLLAQEYDTNQR